MPKKKTKDYPLHISIPMAIFDSADDCRRENNALRSILRKEGLSEIAIQGRVRRLLKKPDLDVSGAQALKQVCEESLKRYRNFDAEELLAKIDPIGGIQ